LLFAAIDVPIAWRSGQWSPVVVLIVLVVVAILFSSLTVEVGDNELRWHFGPGLWTYRLPPQGLANALQSPARRA
jgi:hypothetical protein